MQTDGVKFYSVITGIVVVLVVVLVFAIRGLTRTIQVNVNDSADTAAATEPAPTDATTPVVDTTVTTDTTTPAPTTEITNPNQALIDSLQAIIDAKVILKSGSKGAQVGSLQTFLNLYNKTSTKVDNDFGPGLVAAIKAYQGKNGLPVTGQVAEKTLGKMIEWLKAN